MEGGQETVVPLKRVRRIYKMKSRPYSLHVDLHDPQMSSSSAFIVRTARLQSLQLVCQFVSRSGNIWP